MNTQEVNTQELTQEVNTQEVKTINHWGKWVTSNVPITGVVSNNTPQWLYEEIIYHEVVNLAIEEHQS